MRKQVIVFAMLGLGLIAYLFVHYGGSAPNELPAHEFPEELEPVNDLQNGDSLIEETSPEREATTEKSLSATRQTSSTPETFSISTLADANLVPGLSAWITDQFMIDRPRARNITALKIDTAPLISRSARISMELFSDRSISAVYGDSLNLPHGGLKWFGEIEGDKKGLVNLEIGEFGGITAHITTSTGRIHIRSTPMLPYHVAYFNVVNSDTSE